MLMSSLYITSTHTIFINLVARWLNVIAKWKRLNGSLVWLWKFPWKIIRQFWSLVDFWHYTHTSEVTHLCIKRAQKLFSLWKMKASHAGNSWQQCIPNEICIQWCAYAYTMPYVSSPFLLFLVHQNEGWAFQQSFRKQCTSFLMVDSNFIGARRRKTFIICQNIHPNHPSFMCQTICQSIKLFSLF